MTRVNQSWANILISCLAMFMLSGCASDSKEGISAQKSDDVKLIDGLEYSVLIKWGDQISENHYFGFGSSHVEFIQGEDGSDPQLWVSHELVNPLFVSGYSFSYDVSRERDQIRKELYQVGGTILKLDKSFSSWKYLEDPKNIRVTGAQTFPFEWHEPIRNRTSSFGTVANTNGGMTPWGTILSSEGNFKHYYGDRDYDTKKYDKSNLMWETFLSKPTEHFGWVVEIDPVSRQMKKQIGLGRFAHGAATAVGLPDGRVVIYTGDTRPGGMLYKYISDTPNRIYPGQLYVANMKNKVWRPIDHADEQLNKEFEDETAMMINVPAAAKMVGGTPVESPHGIAKDPNTGGLFIALNGNDSYGEIIRLQENNDDYSAMSFDYETYIACGTEADMANPSLLRFDSYGNLWVGTDMPLESANTDTYLSFGNNGLYVVPAGTSDPIRVATAPMEASFSGISFDPEFENLFVSVNHPGAQSMRGVFTSNWPEGEDNVPKPSVILIQGDFLNELKNID
ncbi:MAG: DUF839 domain-containing protein [Cyclobacteriaceae bacterium]